MEKIKKYTYIAIKIIVKAFLVDFSIKMSQIEVFYQFETKSVFKLIKFIIFPMNNKVSDIGMKVAL